MRQYNRKFSTKIDFLRLYMQRTKEKCRKLLTKIDFLTLYMQRDVKCMGIIR